jgi:hypothetical protein
LKKSFNQNQGGARNEAYNKKLASDRINIIWAIWGFGSKLCGNVGGGGKPHANPKMGLVH